METETAIRFINLVKRHTILYDKRSGGYKRTDLKHKKWHEIAVAMGFKSDEVAVKKWKYLRDKFVKTLRDGKSLHSGMGADEEPEWTLLPYMQFLEPYVKQRKHYTNVSHDTEDEEIIIETESAETEGDPHSQDVEGVEDTRESEDDVVDETPKEPSRSARASVKRISTSSSTSNSSRPSTSSEETPSRRASVATPRARSRSPVQGKSAVDEALLQMGSYFAQKSVDDSDVAFCQFVSAEMRKLTAPRKRQLRRLIIDFLDDE